MKRKIRRRNPLALIVRGIRPSVIPNKKRYNRKRDKTISAKSAWG